MILHESPNIPWIFTSNSTKPICVGTRLIEIQQAELVEMKLVRKNSLRLCSLSAKLEAYLPCQAANYLLAILEGATLFTKDLIHLFTHSLHIPQHFTRATFKCLNWCVASQCQDDH